MIKESCNLIEWESILLYFLNFCALHWGKIILFPYKRISLSFWIIWNLTIPCWSSEWTCNKSSLVWAWLGIPGHNQPKVVVSMLCFITVHWTTHVKNFYLHIDVSISRFSHAVTFLKQNWQHRNYYQQSKHPHFLVAILKRMFWKKITYTKYIIALNLSQIGKKTKHFLKFATNVCYQKKHLFYIFHLCYLSYLFFSVSVCKGLTSNSIVIYSSKNYD